MEDLEERLGLIGKDKQLCEAADELEEIAAQIAGKFDKQSAVLTALASQLRELL